LKSRVHVTVGIVLGVLGIIALAVVAVVIYRKKVTSRVPNQ
ncbi:hypothetical protein scyTo_0019026, partial [Scyliorhinus torazame]|nr:hypothetical protein [Scyliorhinus torazame]